MAVFETETMRVAGVILAAGFGSRLGRTKQLLPLRGEPLLAHVVRAAEQSSLAEIIVVLGHDAARVMAALPAGRARMLYNPRYFEGQSTSLHTGLRALDQHTEAVLVILGDQPGIRTDVIDAVANAYLAVVAPSAGVGSAGNGGVRRPLVVIPTYGGHDGHPILLARALWPEVLAVEGDQGARAVIRAHADDVLRLPVASDLPPADVDTEDDYAAVLREGEA